MPEFEKQTDKEIEAAVAKFSELVMTHKVPYADEINSIFRLKGGSIQDIFNRLNELKFERKTRINQAKFAAKTLDILKARPPTSLCAAFEAL